MTSEERSYQAYYEFTDNAGERHFYEISTRETSVTIRFGQVGSQGNAEKHSFDTVAEARRFAAERIEDARQRFSFSSPRNFGASSRSVSAPPPRPSRPAKYAETAALAGFGERAAATFIDWLLQGTLWFVTTVPLMLILGKGNKNSWLPFFMLLLVSSLYSTYYESSPQQATPGKRALGLIVTDLEGKRLSPGKAFARWVLRLVSQSLTGGLGVVLAALTKQRQTIHDILAGTLVYSKADFERFIASSHSSALTAEKIILRAAREYHGVLTATKLAMDTELSLEEAEAELQSLALRGVCQMELTDGGRVEYRFPDLLPE